MTTRRATSLRFRQKARARTRIRTVSAILTDRITATGSSIISANRIRAARSAISRQASASPRISAPESLAMK